eukprot:762874-Hanusia_phi.AAC.1
MMNMGSREIGREVDGAGGIRGNVGDEGRIVKVDYTEEAGRKEDLIKREGRGSWGRCRGREEGEKGGTDRYGKGGRWGRGGGEEEGKGEQGRRVREGKGTGEEGEVSEGGVCSMRV